MSVFSYGVKCIKYNPASSCETTDIGLEVRGRVREGGKPKPSVVKLFEQSSGALVQVKLTTQEGEFRFDHLKKTKFFVVAQHPDATLPAVIQDNVVPK